MCLELAKWGPLQTAARKGLLTGRFVEIEGPLCRFVEDQREVQLPVMIEVLPLKGLELARDQGMLVTPFKASRQD